MYRVICFLFIPQTWTFNQMRPSLMDIRTSYSTSFKRTKGVTDKVMLVCFFNQMFSSWGSGCNIVLKAHEMVDRIGKLKIKSKM